ncbi:nucleotidyltransferase domain-containing protein [Jeotgalibacillus proteolyticus]|uniref:nucleotidyltransferase domain-containing protein n=1 Tax=Jeotgalibacillus proteolyticus TaxID=2082395 RepID=UPI003CF32338
MKRTFKLNQSSLSNEVLFLLDLIKQEPGSIQINKDLVEKIDWNLFITQAFHHRVYPALLSRISQSNEIPEHVKTVLNSEFKRNTLKMLYLSAEMEKIHQLFSKKSISTLCLKGPVLAHQLYGDLSLRTSNDLDILIPMKDIEKAEELLLYEGYQKDDYIHSVLNDWRWRHHHITYSHPVKKTKVEVHWRLSPGPGKEPGFHELWSRRVKSELPHSSVYMLGNEDLFLFLASHGARHGWSRLRWLMDIKQLMKQELDWQLLSSVLKKNYIEHVAGQSIVLAQQLLQAECTSAAARLASTQRSQKLAQDAMFYLESMINLHTDPVPENVSTYHQKHLFTLMSPHQKSLYFLSTLHPYAEDAKTLPLPKQLHFLYFPLRPLLVIWRKRGKHAMP